MGLGADGQAELLWVIYILYDGIYLFFGYGNVLFT